MAVIENVDGSRTVAIDSEQRLLTTNEVQVGTGGQFKIATKSGSTAGLAANGVLHSVRWASTTHNMVIHRVELGIVPVTAYTTVFYHEIRMQLARSFTVEQTGGTNYLTAQAPTPLVSGGNASRLTEYRVPTTTALVGGTLTYETGYVGLIPFYCGAALGPYLPQSDGVLDFTGPSGPIILTANQGYTLRTNAAFGATGATIFFISTTWSEVPV